MSNFNAWEAVGKKRISVVGGRSTKKMTGTRLGAVLGWNNWKTPFGAWCEIMRVAEPPFEGNKYTEAGEAIEPKLLAWCKENVSPHIVTPNEWFNTKQKLYDHFPDESIFGGQWDGLVLEGEGGNPIALIEAKTSSRPQDWVNGVPPSYAIQGLSYAALMGLERVFFPVAFLDPEDYAKPEKFVCTSKNTFLYEINTETWKIDQPGWGMEITIHDLLGEARTWYSRHVEGNESPEFDEKRDKEYLDILRKRVVSSDDLEALAVQASALEDKIAAMVAKLPELKAAERELKKIKDQMKPVMLGLFTEKDEAVTAYGWVLKKTESETIDKEAMQRDSVLEKYTVKDVSYRLSKEKNNG